MDATDRIAFRFSRWYLRHRLANLLAIVAVTLFFGMHALQLEVFSQFVDLLPREHPYIEVYERYNRQFGSANVVFAALVATRGSIYDEAFLEQVHLFTDGIDKIEGIDHDQVTSITHIKVRDHAIDAQGTLLSDQIVGDEAIALFEARSGARRAIQRARQRGEEPPRSLDELARLASSRLAAVREQLAASLPERPAGEEPERAAALRALRLEAAETDLLLLRLRALPDGYRLDGDTIVGPGGAILPAEVVQRLPGRLRPNKLVFGRLVSRDETAALVVAGFLEGRLDYDQIFERAHELKREIEASGVAEVHLTGMPILQGWCFHYAPEIVLILAATLGMLVVLLGVYFRQWYGVVLPLSSALLSGVWGLGFIALMEYQLEPLVLVIPMLITARAISHSVQFVERFYEEYESQHDQREAVITSMAHLLLPGTLAILTDAFGIYVISICSIPLMKKVATFGAFWALSLIVTGLLFNRILLSYFPPPRSFEHYTPRPIARFLGAVARAATDPRRARIVFGIWLVVFAGSLLLSTRVRVGEYRPGTPILWEDSEFNRSAKVVADKFYGADDLVVVVQTEQPFGIHRPDTMHEIERFQRYMENDPKVGGTISIVDYLKAITRTFHFGDPRWRSIPYTGQQTGGLLYLYEAGSPDPRVLNPYRDEHAQDAAVRIFYQDHQGPTVEGAIGRVQRYIAEHPTGRVSIRTDTAKPGAWRRILGPLLPPQNAELVVLVRADGGYVRQPIVHPDRREPPPPDSQQWILTLPRMTPELQRALVAAGYRSVAAIAQGDVAALARVEGYDLVSARQLRDAARLDRSAYTVRAEWSDEGGGIQAQIRRRGLYERPELWVRFAGGDFVQRVSGTWSEGPSFALASGLVGLLAASNEEVARSNNAVLVACFTAYFLMILVSYRSLGMAVLLLTSLGTAALVSIAFMWVRNMGFDVNTLPVQALGVGIGDDYALYIMDRVMRERKNGHSLRVSVQTAIRTTGMAIFFTGTTLVGGIIFWYFLSSLRFAAEMSLLLSVLLVANLFGAIVLVPAFTVLFEPRYTRAPTSAPGFGEPVAEAGP